MLDYVLKNKNKFINIARKYSNDPEDIYGEFCLKAAFKNVDKIVDENRYYTKAFVNFCISYVRDNHKVKYVFFEDFIEQNENLKDILIYSNNKENDTIPTPFYETVESKETLEKFIFYAKPYLTTKELKILQKIVEALLKGEKVELAALVAQELNEPRNRIKILFHFIKTKLKNKNKLKKILQS